MPMHKVFYASGFLYHPPTQQILLHQSSEDGVTLSTFSGKFSGDEKADKVFKDLIAKTLGLDLTDKNIYEVYDYFHEELGAHCFVFFANVKKQTLEFKLKGVESVGWFPLKQLPKLKLAGKARQDIIVGQRVINYIDRQKAEKIAATS